MRQRILLIVILLFTACANESKIETVKVQKVILEGTIVTKKVKVEPKEREKNRFRILTRYFRLFFR
ncbi:MAG: hypothetical protein ACI85O_001930 [Saprospiraceae bacterium]|jgi:uncharacterized protein YcfL